MTALSASAESGAPAGENAGEPSFSPRTTARPMFPARRQIRRITYARDEPRLLVFARFGVESRALVGVKEFQNLGARGGAVLCDTTKSRAMAFQRKLAPAFQKLTETICAAVRAFCKASN